jgi:hypothetical protein
MPNNKIAGGSGTIAELANEERTHERLEVSILNNLYRQISPISDIPDKGMQLSGRMDSETPTIVKNNCSVVIHGLSDLLEI